MTTKPVAQPLVVVGLYGGLVQWTAILPGAGLPVVDVLDFDREGEDDEERREWLAYARSVERRLRAFDTEPVSSTQTAIEVAETLRQSLDRMEPDR